MTFEAMDTRVPAAAADETTASASRAPRRAARAANPLDTMLDFATEGEMVATQLRGLAALFRGVFCDEDVRRSDDASAAADIVDDVMKTIASRLEANAERARVARQHLGTGGAR